MPALVTGRAVQELAAHPSSCQLVPVRVQDGAATPTGHDGAAMLRGAAVADGLAVVPAGKPVEAGADVSVVPLP